LIKIYQKQADVKISYC